ncbi:MAG: MFS transporter [Roseiflexaceae bacterium]|nr:MFS transporter [Roseiflexaceae bacterium]
METIADQYVASWSEVLIRILRVPPLGIILVAVFVDLLGYGIIIPLLPIVIERLGGGATLVGILAALYALIQGLCGPLLGAASDRYGRRPILLLCLLGTGTSYLLLGLAQSLPLLAFAMLLDALTGANLSTAQAYVADTATPAARAHSFGLLGIAFALGVTVGPTLGGLLSTLGPSVPAFAAGTMALLNLLLMLVALPESLPPERRTQHLPNPFAPLIGPTMAAGIRRLLLMVMLINLAFAGLQSNFPIFSRARFGWDTAANAYFFAFVGLCAVLTQGLLLGLLRRSVSEQWLVLAGAALMAGALPLLGLVSSGWMLYPLAAAVALGSNLCIPSLTSLLIGHGDETMQGRILGMQQIAINLALAAGPLIAGIAYDWAGPTAPYLAGGVFALLALGVGYMQNRRHRPTNPIL